MLNQIAQTGQKASLETCLLQISTINCHWRLPTSFNNLEKLFVNNQNGDGRDAPTVDIYCVNLQQIVYRGARTVFKGDAEAQPARTWVE